MSETEAKNDVPAEEKTAEEIKGVKRAAEVRIRIFLHILFTYIPSYRQIFTPPEPAK